MRYRVHLSHYSRAEIWLGSLFSPIGNRSLITSWRGDTLWQVMRHLAYAPPKGLPDWPQTRVFQ